MSRSNEWETDKWQPLTSNRVSARVEEIKFSICDHGAVACPLPVVEGRLGCFLIILSFDIIRDVVTWWTRDQAYEAAPELQVGRNLLIALLSWSESRVWQNQPVKAHSCSLEKKEGGSKLKFSNFKEHENPIRQYFFKMKKPFPTS